MSRSSAASSALAVLAVLAFAALPSCAQDHDAGMHHPTTRVPMPAIAFPKGADHVDLPFTERRNHIVVDAVLQQQGHVRCALDTGARGTVIMGDSLVNALGMTPVGEAKIQGAGGGGTPIHGSVYMGVTIGLGAMTLSNTMLVSMPDSAMPVNSLRGTMALGHGLWEQVVAEIDWDAHVVRLHDPATFTYTGHGVSVPLELDAGGLPHVTARVALPGGAPFDVSLVLDTGASHALQLQPGSDPRIVSPAGAPRQRIGKGATGQVWGAIGRATSFTIGGVTFKDLPVTFPDSSLGLPAEHVRQGNLGSGLLRRFRVILDYPHHRMILEPGPHVNEPIVLPSFDEVD